MFIAEETTLLVRRGKSRPAVVLAPAQEAAAQELLKSMSKGGVSVLRAATGSGRTTVLQHVHAVAGGAWLGMKDFIDALMVRRPDALEQAFVEMLEQAIENNTVVIVDDLHLITAITNGYKYERRGLLDAALEALLTTAAAAGRKLIFGVDPGNIPAAVWVRAHVVKIRDFDAADYATIAASRLGDRAGAVDFDCVFRAAPALHAHQILRAARPTTEAFIEHLAQHNLTSNVELDEVPPVDWKDLKGMDDVIAALEAKIALPFENAALAAELNLKPKRGVLLAGPPGTGKTTIGRALAHRLRGKFFLIDGTVIAGSADFHDDVALIFERAKKNAPAVIFIDDSDVIFEDNSKGFYRYLLTMLDGLESASAERVCVMMTAMDVGSLPPALLRSGRIELWLETRLPDEAARAAILLEKLSGLPRPLACADIALLAAASRNLTGADLKTVIEDGKLSFAFDLANALPAKPVEEYFLQAIAEVRNHRRKYTRGKLPKPDDDARFGFATA